MSSRDTHSFGTTTVDTKLATVDELTTLQDHTQDHMQDHMQDHTQDRDGRKETDISTKLLSDKFEDGVAICVIAADSTNVLNGANIIKEKSCRADPVADGAARYRMIYRISETPPIYMLVFYALQQALLSIARPLTITVLVSEVACAQKDEYIKTQILSASIFMTGLSTFMVTTFGVRLPIFQTGDFSFLLPLMMMSSSDEWRCPAILEDNSTTPMVMIDNMTTIPARDLILVKLSKFNGSLMVVGAVHFIIGFTGLAGILIRFIGPVTIVPTIFLVSMILHKVVVKMAEPNWIVAILTCAVSFTLSLCLAGKKTPIPAWSRGRGFHIFWYPLHQSFSAILSITFGWTLSAILTVTGAITDDPTSLQYQARTDARSAVIDQTDWFTVPYPGKLSSFSISTTAVIGGLGCTFVSVLDSIGDYTTSARACRVPPPPRSAFNRGIAVEGLMNFLGGAIGCCHQTVSSGSSIGIITITRVASRRVLQCCGIFYILMACFGKFGAVFITLPYPVLGGITFLVTGIFLGFALSLLQTINLNSTRNLAIICTAIMLGLMLPYWVNTRIGVLDTGNAEINSLLLAITSNPAVVGGIYACVMDNIIPGSLTERGLLHQMKDLDDEDAKRLAQLYDDGPEVYRFPFIPPSFYKLKFVKYLPVFDYTGK